MHAGEQGSSRYPQAITASFRRPVLLPAHLQCRWTQNSTRNLGLSFGVPKAGLQYMSAKSVDFVVCAESSGKVLVEGSVSTGVAKADHDQAQG